MPKDDTRSKQEKMRSWSLGQRCYVGGCVLFVNNMEQFIQKAQCIENTPSDQSSQCAIKR